MFRSIKFVSILYLSYPSRSTRERVENKGHALLTSFCRFSTEPGLDNPSAALHPEKRLYAFERGDKNVGLLDDEAKADEDEGVETGYDGYEGGNFSEEGMAVAMVGGERSVLCQWDATLRSRRFPCGKYCRAHK